MSTFPTGRAEGAAAGGAYVWVMAARPRTLAAAVMPVMVGTALAARLDAWQTVPALLCLFFALFVQVGTNYANDYFDFVKGADTAARIGPTRVVAAGLVSMRAMRRAIAGVFLLAFLVGFNLVFYGGWWLVVVGVLSILCGLAYTGGPFPFAYNSLGDLFVFIFFGLVAVGFTFFVQTGFFSWEVWLGGAAIGGLATNILVVNNLRDRETDAAAGKTTLVVRLGRKWALVQYAGSLLLSAIIPFVFLLAGHGRLILLPLLLAPLGYRSFNRLRVLGPGGDHHAALAGSGFILIAYGSLLSLGLLLS